MNDELYRQLSSLPNEVIDENIASWKRVISQIEQTIAKGASKYWIPSRLNSIRQLAELDEARLFRAGLSRVYLTISTAQKQGLDKGQLFIRLIWNETNQPVFEYCKFGKKSAQNYRCRSDRDIVSVVSPLLKRLWYESKDKLEAKQSPGTDPTE
jgi:hypothetical protein